MLQFLLHSYRPFKKSRRPFVSDWDRLRPPIELEKRSAHGTPLPLRPCNVFQTRQEYFSDDETLDAFPPVADSGQKKPLSSQITPHIGMVFILYVS
jgi:hypothetical protein